MSKRSESAHPEKAIAAISTPPGQGAIAIVRMTGHQVIPLADKVFKGNSRLTMADSHTLHYGFIIDPHDGQKIDEVLVAVMRAPRTYTGEDMIEINCHGGALVSGNILRLMLRQGARLAAPGEFTRRAYLNGRMDLLQAEAVAEVIRSRTDLSLRTAQRQLRGGCSDQLKAIRQDLIESLALVEAGLDFSDRELPEDLAGQAREPLQRSREALLGLLQGAHFGHQLREGFTVVLVGRPNVGKSSLFNAVLGNDRVIVAPDPGTTRDTVSEDVSLKGLPIKLVDTAGLHAAAELVEKEGVHRTRQQMDSADLLVIVLDGSEHIQPEDVEILGETATRPSLLIINKIDLTRLVTGNDLEKMRSSRKVIEVSATRGDGVEEMVAAIGNELKNGHGDGTDLYLVATIRHQEILSQSLKAVQHAYRGLLDGAGEELIAEDIRSALSSMAEMIGQTRDRDVLDRIFQSFCVGK
jgi:tRNA modification GTPase